MKTNSMKWGFFTLVILGIFIASCEREPMEPEVWASKIPNGSVELQEECHPFYLSPGFKNVDFEDAYFSTVGSFFVFDSETYPCAPYPHQNRPDSYFYPGTLAYGWMGNMVNARIKVYEMTQDEPLFFGNINSQQFDYDGVNAFRFRQAGFPDDDKIYKMFLDLVWDIGGNSNYGVNQYDLVFFYDGGLQKILPADNFGGTTLGNGTLNAGDGPPGGSSIPFIIPQND